MDCTKLKANIERMRTARETFDSIATPVIETGLGRRKCEKALRQISEIEDDILQAYLEDFAEHNEGLSSSFSIGENIRGFGYLGICSAIKLSDDEVLVCGEVGETRILRRENGEFVYGEKIEGFGHVGLAARDITTATKLSDDEVLVCGESGETYILHKENGEYVYGDPIEGVSEHHDIKFTLKLSDDEVLVCGEEIRILRRENGEWKYANEEIGDLWGNTMYTALKLSDDEVLVCGGNGETRILRKEDGQYSYGERIWGFNYDPYDTAIRLSDDDVLIASRGSTSILQKGEGGQWRYVDLVEDGFSDGIYAATKISDGEALVFGGHEDRFGVKIIHKKGDKYAYDNVTVNGDFDTEISTVLKLSNNELLLFSATEDETRIMKGNPVDLDTLKQRLPDIANLKI